MRSLLGAFLVGLLGLSMQAQQRGMPRTGPSFPTDSSLPSIAPIPPLGGSRAPMQRFGQPSGRPGGRQYSGFPYWFPFSTGYTTVPESPQNVVVMQSAPQPQPAVTPKPAPSPKSEIRDYTWQTSGAVQSTSFSIALKDGRTEMADAVWVQSGFVRFVTPQGEDRSVPLDKVDRERTERMNRENGLRLRIPHAQSSQAGK